MGGETTAEKTSNIYTRGNSWGEQETDCMWGHQGLNMEARTEQEAKGNYNNNQTREQMAQKTGQRDETRPPGSSETQRRQENSESHKQNYRTPKNIKPQDIIQRYSKILGPEPRDQDNTVLFRETEFKTFPVYIIDNCYY